MARTPHPFSGYTAGPSHNSIEPAGFGCGIPLNVLAQVIALLDDDPRTLARLCRASRVFYYMTLPHLWKKVTLRSYDTFRWNDNLPEGFGSASPFSLGLNALVTHNVNNLVKSLSLVGDWTATDLGQCSKVGRLSESAMILNIALRAAIDRCTQLESFQWDLGTKLLPNALTGLAALSNLTSFHLRCPSSKVPQPTAELPALPHLRAFTMTHYDPLCYPDDISRLLLFATKLEVLNLHFSPRMRDAGEPSVHLSHFFRHNIAAGRPLRLQKMGLYNLFSRAAGPELLGAVDTSNISDFTSLNTFGSDEDAPLNSASVSTGFIDNTWLASNDAEFPPMVRIRIDQLHHSHAEGIGPGLEKLYLVNTRYTNTKPDTPAPSTSTTSPTSHPTPSSTTDTSNPSTTLCVQNTASQRSFNGVTPPTPTTTPHTVCLPSPNSSSSILRDLYLTAITTRAGPSLKHLIFPAKWPFAINAMSKLIRACPNLTQLSCALDCADFKVFRMIVPFLTKLYAIRIVALSGYEDLEQMTEDKCDGAGEKEKWLTKDGFDMFAEMLRREMEMEDFRNVRYVGLGRKWFEVGGVEAVREEGRNGGVDGEEVRGEEAVVMRRAVRRVGWEEVKGVEIWGCDSLDVV